MSADRIARLIIRWTVTILVPLALMMTSIRILLNPLFLQFEYNTPGFPADSYGFSYDERMEWARYAVDYLVNDDDISYLGDLTFDNGQPLYNERELSHMEDVKALVQTGLNAWTISVGLLVGLGVAAWGSKWSNDFRLGLRTGGWLTVGLLVAVLFGVMIGFDTLFTDFHRIFFEGDTWLFYTSDTLIRLFPMRFWRDAFLLFGAFTLAGGLLLGIFIKPKYALGQVSKGTASSKP